MSASTEFSLQFFKAASPQDKNYVISPFSLAAALAIVHDGARGETQAEITRLLGKTMSPSEVSSLYSSITAALNDQNSAVITHMANRLYLDKDISLKPEYQRHIETAFNAGVENINFEDSERAAECINEFVHYNTDGKIYPAVNAGGLVGVSSLLINTVYFLGEWKTPFDSENTRVSTFHGIAGDRNIPFMNNYELTARYYLSKDLSVVSLPYQDRTYSMIVLMPHGDFRKWKESLNAQILEGIPVKSGKIKLKLPKFKIESKTRANEALEKCGVRKMFTRGIADLSGISHERLRISTIAQTTFIEVSEWGTEAGAATSCEWVRDCMPPPLPKLTFDRPFIYAILRAEHILFIGQHV